MLCVGRWAKWVRGIKEGTSWDKHWVLHIGDELLESIPEIIIAYMLINLDVNLKINK